MTSRNSTSTLFNTNRRKRPRIIIYQNKVLVRYPSRGIGRLIAKNGNMYQVLHEKGYMIEYSIEALSSGLLTLIDQEEANQYSSKFNDRYSFREYAFPKGSPVEHIEYGKGKVCNQKSRGRVVQFENEKVSFCRKDLENPDLWQHYSFGIFKKPAKKR